MIQTSERLTHTERTCLQLAARGHSPDAIAEHMGGRQGIAEIQLASARKKLMASTTIEALARALKFGLIE